VEAIMKFDPAVAAQTSLRRAQQSGELGEDLTRAVETEEIFSAEMGEAAKVAYQTLQKIGERHPEAAFFQEYLIYLTWQQVMAEPIPMYFQKGAELCDRYLKQGGDRHDETQVRQIRELRASFRAGLGLGDSEPELYDEDTVKGGD
jgi:hypothetical protein